MERSELLSAKYANYFQAGQNSTEFVIDFGQLYSDEAVPFFHTRIVTSPVYAKKLLLLLQESLAQHEADFGPVRERRL
jgi:hypothetical protein